MSNDKTVVTELATALGILNAERDKLAAKSLPKIVGVDKKSWAVVFEAASGGEHGALFEIAFANGEYFRSATHALRGRSPINVEWKGRHKSVGDEATPADLRVDHVYLVSCKYDSDILLNSSPTALFNRLLTGGQGRRSKVDWYHETAPSEYQGYYEEALNLIGVLGFPALVTDLERSHRDALKVLGRQSSPALDEAAGRFYQKVSEVSAQRWKQRMTVDETDDVRMLWRLLRIGSAPYFVLGSATDGPKRIRVATPWDWSRRYELNSLQIDPGNSGQPTVTWKAIYDDKMTSIRGTVSGFVEIRWSHGKFGGFPEAKIHLDPNSSEVPGYFDLD